MMQKQKLIPFQNLNGALAHAKEQHMTIVIYKKIVYDVSEFKYQHPGGSEIFEQFGNQNVDNIIFNPKYHKHSTQIISVLEQYKYGYITCNEEVEEESPIPREKQEQRTKTKIGSIKKFLAFEAEFKQSSIKNIIALSPNLSNQFSQKPQMPSLKCIPSITNMELFNDEFDNQIPDDNQNCNFLQVPKFTSKLINQFRSNRSVALSLQEKKIKNLSQ